jgi:PBP1b-binding outer membrane lipoprotein LpoB
LQHLSIFLPLAAACLISGCTSNSTGRTTPAPPTAAQPAAAAPTEDIPPIDPIWDAMAKQQAHLDQVEKIRTGNPDAVSCQKVRSAPQHRVKVDTSACNPIQLRAEQDAAHEQLFNKMVKNLRHEN